MLVEYAIIPDVLDLASYSSPEVLEARLQVLKPILLEDGLVRDMRGGEWSSYIAHWLKDLPEQCHPKAKELLKKLKQKNRLRQVSFCGPNQPCCAQTWFDEAIASHGWQSLLGIIASKTAAQQHKENNVVTCIERLTRPDSSVELRKQSSAYLEHLKLLLSHASSIQFIDPYLDPTQPHYEQFHFLLTAAKRQDWPPILEFHISASGHGLNGGDRSQFTQAEWKSRFSKLSPTLQAASLTATVYVWEYFHDRFIISNLAGISLSNGLDIHREGTAVWSRLPSQLRDEKQRDFAANSPKYKLKYQFTLL